MELFFFQPVKVIELRNRIIILLRNLLTLLSGKNFRLTCSDILFLTCENFEKFFILLVLFVQYFFHLIFLTPQHLHFMLKISIFGVKLVLQFVVFSLQFINLLL